jgi:hypothetical protein
MQPPCCFTMYKQCCNKSCIFFEYLLPYEARIPTQLSLPFRTPFEPSRSTSIRRFFPFYSYIRPCHEAAILSRQHRNSLLGVPGRFGLFGLSGRWVELVQILFRLVILNLTFSACLVLCSPPVLFFCFNWATRSPRCYSVFWEYLVLCFNHYCVLLWVTAGRIRIICDCGRRHKTTPSFSTHACNHYGVSCATDLYYVFI